MRRLRSRRGRILLLCVFAACGVFVLGFGSVSASASPALEAKLSDDVGEVQWLQVDASAGEFELCYEVVCTRDLVYNLSGASIVV
jgi:hypothetical protein